MIGIYDLEKLKEPIDNVSWADHIATNAGYGNMYQLKKYAGLDENTIMNCTIEHGFYTHNGGMCYELMHNISTILTWSDYRKKILEERYPVKAVPVGPYIAYAQGIYSADKIRAMRKNNGRTLLVMPSHTALEIKMQFDFGEWCKAIYEVSKGVDRVVVSLPAYDLQSNVDAQYIALGFEVVSAGGNGDKYFLDRLKSIIELSDVVMANEFTTGLIYAIFLGKPVYLFNQDMKMKVRSKVIYRLSEEEPLLDIFKEISNDKTFCKYLEQKKFGERYAGFLQVKTKKELREILERNSRDRGFRNHGEFS